MYYAISNRYYKKDDSLVAQVILFKGGKRGAFRAVEVELQRIMENPDVRYYHDVFMSENVLDYPVVNPDNGFNR